MSSITFSIGGDNTKFRAVAKDTQAIGNRMAANISKGLGGSIKSVGLSFAGFAAGFVTVQAAYTSFSQALNAGGRLNDLSAKIGASAGQLAIMERAFENTGLAVEGVGPAFAKMNRLLADAFRGSSSAEEKLGSLGLTSSSLVGKLPTEQMAILADAIARIEDPTRRSAAAMDVFGKSGSEMLPLLRNFSAELGAAQKQLGSWPAILDQANVDMDALGDNFAAVQKKGMEFAGGILSVVAPALAKLSESLAEIDAAGAGAETAKFLSNKGAQGFQVNTKQWIAGKYAGAAEKLDSIPILNVLSVIPRKMGSLFMDEADRLRDKFELWEPKVDLGKADSAIKSITDNLPKAGLNFSVAAKSSVDSIGEAAKKVAMATKPPGALKFSVPVPMLGAGVGLTSTRVAVPKLNLSATRGTFFNDAARGFNRMFGGSPLGSSSLSKSNLTGMAGAGQYGGSYGLIRRGDTAMKAAAAREAKAEAEKKDGEKTPEAESLEKILGVMEQAWAR